MPRCHPDYIDFGCLTSLVAYVYMMSLLIHLNLCLCLLATKPTASAGGKSITGKQSTPGNITGIME